MIKAWAFEFNSILSPDRPDFRDEKQVQAAFVANLAHIAGLEKRGFEGVFFGEHHFINTMNPSPHLMIAAAAQHTKTLKLGVMGTVLAFHHPWRVAEELGMLDYLTEGRLEIGVAAGVPPEFLFVGIPQDEVRPMYEESLDFLDKALESTHVTHEGRFWEFDELPILPPMKKVGRRRKWMTIYSAGSCRIAARRGYRVCTGVQTVENATKAFDAYREEADRIGYEVGPEDISIRRHVLIADTDADAEELFQATQPASLERLAEAFAPVNERLQKALGHGAPPEALKSGLVDAASPRRTDPGEEHLPDASKLTRIDIKDVGPLDDEYIFGSPVTVAEKVIDQCRSLGAGHILALTLMTHTKRDLARHYDLWEKVIPILRTAKVAG
ncbi:LLM class flavin-dependent oxidoreductase [Streptomyces justiciae]|uniref:LLM class flavin-dependent oxidoreductase n=1 Tax=Streptomyces justiciae TaxID=2780140 RepID=UPI00211877B1|nr:LLM class flavin-dependent oxidoreductase [Streptomyces justiciae]MCW8378697.1 LLM class flavin-dependent oxidoreductase [Streptomyces justiciae]